MYNLNINNTLREYIDSVKGSYSRAKYILQCVKYIKTNGIDIYGHYEGDKDYERTSKDDKRREGTD